MARRDGEDDATIRAVAEAAHVLRGGPQDFDALLDLFGDARCVLIGEATHGTHDFYRVRAELTKRLLVEKGFCAVAAEADWPDAYRVNRYVHGVGSDADAVDSLSDFRRFPSWMWRNADVLDFVGWLRAHNEGRDARERVGFYGLDVYSLHASITAVLAYLGDSDPEAARRARQRYSCFDQWGANPQAYGYKSTFGLGPNCENEVIAQLVDMQHARSKLLHADGLVADDALFEAEQNARVAKNAEAYYRAMFLGRVSSWNVRDSHMMETLDALLVHLARRTSASPSASKIVVWAHNSHVGDARATEMGRAGEHTLGQLARERFPRETCLVGFTTYDGSVTAASDWGAAAERKVVRSALPRSFEALFHEVGTPNFWVRTRDVATVLDEPRLERAIGVVYLPRSERASHYVQAQLPKQFDALIHLDHTRALEPLERTATWERGELPETYPTGL